MEKSVRLRKGDFWKGTCPKDGALEITCQAGALWVTREGDQRDHCLNEGETYRTTNPGWVIVQALGDGAKMRWVSQGRILTTPDTAATLRGNLFK